MEKKGYGMEQGDMFSRREYCAMLTQCVGVYRWEGSRLEPHSFCVYCRRITGVSCSCNFGLQCWLAVAADAPRHLPSMKSCCRASPVVDYSWTITQNFLLADFWPKDVTHTYLDSPGSLPLLHHLASPVSVHHRSSSWSSSRVSGELEEIFLCGSLLYSAGEELNTVAFRVVDAVWNRGIYKQQLCKPAITDWHGGCFQSAFLPSLVSQKELFCLLRAQFPEHLAHGGETAKWGQRFH